MKKISLLMELWQFISENKKWWMAPIIIVLLILGTILVLAQNSALGPFIYTMF